MRQIIHIAINNVLNSKAKALIIIILMSVSLFVATLGYSLGQATSSRVDVKTEELQALSKIKVLPNNESNSISFTSIDYIEKMDGVEYVVPQYNIGGLLEEKVNEPIYPVSINGYDFEDNVFMNTLDFTHQGVSGIVLPDLVVELNRTIVLKDYVGTTIFFTYEYIQDGKVKSETVECEVIGVYEAKGSFEANPVYMSMDIFEGILNNVSDNLTGVARVQVYLENVEMIEKVAEDISDLGLEVYYESTLNDYLNSLEGFIKLVIAVSCIIMLFAIIVMIQAILGNMKKRSTIIGVLKAYGYSDLVIYFMVFIEMLFYSIFAIFITFLVCVVLKDTINEFFSMFMSGIVFELSLGCVMMEMLMIMLVLIVSSIIPIKKLAKMNIIDVLKSD